MTTLHRGIAVTILQSLIVISVAGKYALDREQLPRVWARAEPFDPNLPVRGRYVRLALEVTGEGMPSWGWAELRVQDRRLVAVRSEKQTGVIVTARANGRFVLAEPVAFFIQERAEDPSRRPPGEELWVEVSVPRNGAPRPLRLGVKKNDALTPLEIH
jgi:GDYXXLXY protein